VFFKGSTYVSVFAAIPFTLLAFQRSVLLAMISSLIANQFYDILKEAIGNYLISSISAQ
jgi:uncharacterized protein involved in cysteine biosynthesis